MPSVFLDIFVVDLSRMSSQHVIIQWLFLDDRNHSRNDAHQKLFMGRYGYYWQTFNKLLKSLRLYIIHYDNHHLPQFWSRRTAWFHANKPWTIQLTEEQDLPDIMRYKGNQNFIGMLQHGSHTFALARKTLTTTATSLFCPWMTCTAAREAQNQENVIYCYTIFI